MYDTCAKGGPAEEELEVAKKQMANTFDEQMKEPSFWLGRISTMTFNGINLDDVVKAPAAYQALTAKAGEGHLREVLRQAECNRGDGEAAGGIRRCAGKGCGRGVIDSLSLSGRG